MGIWDIGKSAGEGVGGYVGGLSQNEIDALINKYGPGGNGGYGGGGGGGYSTPWGSTQEAAQLAGTQTQEQLATQHAQSLEVLDRQHQQALQRGDIEAARAFEQQKQALQIQFEQDVWKINRNQQLDLEKMDVQNKFDAAQGQLQREYDSLEAQKQRAFQAGENEKGREFERQQMILQQKFTALEAQKNRDFEAIESEKGREFEKEMRQEELGAKRQEIYSEMMGRDPVRAALYAMGVGGEILPGGEQFGGLPPMKGAMGRGVEIEQALTGLFKGRPRQGVPPSAQLPGAPTPTIKLGGAGVTGLPEAVKSATAYQRGGQPAKTLLESAYGVGATTGKGRPGIVPEEMQRIIQSVTPRGSLST